MIIGLEGDPGSGKTYNLSELALSLSRPSKYYPSGRRVYANYPLHGASRLVTVADVLSREFADSILALSELGGELDARQHTDLDPLVSLALKQHRKNGCTIIYDTQTLEMVDLTLRRLTETVIVVTRWGPGGESTQALVRSGRSGKVRKPWFFTRRWFDRADVDPEWTLERRLLAKPYKRELIWFRRSVAESYCSYDAMIPLALVERVNEVRAGAAARAALPAMEVRAGRLVRHVYARLAEVSAPAVLTPAEVKRSGPPSSEVVLRERLRALGLRGVDDDAVPEDETAPVGKEVRPLRGRVLSAMAGVRQGHAAYFVEVATEGGQVDLIVYRHMHGWETGDRPVEDWVGRELRCEVVLRDPDAAQSAIRVARDTPIVIR